MTPLTMCREGKTGERKVRRPAVLIFKGARSGTNERAKYDYNVSKKSYGGHGYAVLVVGCKRTDHRQD